MVKYAVFVSILQKHQGLDVALFGGVGDTAPLGIVTHADHIFESAAVLSQHISPGSYAQGEHHMVGLNAFFFPGLYIFDHHIAIADLGEHGVQVHGGVLGFDAAHYVVDDDGEKALELLGVERYDLVLLDLNLPGKDGMTVLRTLRQTDRETRVLILSARSEVEDKVEGLDAGANDYLAKPFHLAELEARIRSLTLRQFTQQDVLLTCGDLAFDTRSRTASVNGQALTLTRKETGILEYLMVHQGRPVSQEELMDHVWDNSVDSFSNSIRVHISALRKKLRAALGYDPIRNRIGEGYLMGGEEE